MLCINILSCNNYYKTLFLQVAHKFNSFMSGNIPEKCKLIVSSHNYEYTPSCEDLANLVARIQAVGADIVKIATTAKDIIDVSRMFEVMVHCQVSVFQTQEHFSLFFY
jgi:3-dehydroquinate dehydratase / shikimate dehydrogenase